MRQSTTRRAAELTGAICVGLICAASLGAQGVTRAPWLASASAPVATVGTVLGFVADGNGHPEAGALVQLEAEGMHRTATRLMTSPQGVVSFSGLAPGEYVIRAGKGERIADLQRVRVQAAERTLVLLNLPQVLAGIRLGQPLSAEDQQFRWTVRQATELRPVLRFADPGTGTSAPVAMTGTVSVVAGGDPSSAGSGAVATGFQLDTELGWARMNLNGNLGSSSIGEGSDIAAVFRGEGEASQARLGVAMQQVGTAAPGAPALRVVTFNYADGVTDGNFQLQYGAEYNTVSLNDATHTFNPYMRAVYRLNGQAQIEYRAALAVPPLEFDADHAEMENPMPRVSLQPGVGLRVESAHHQEVMVADSLTANDAITAAVYEEHYEQAALYGVGGNGAVLSQSDLLPALMGNMFTVNGGDYGGGGYRFTYQRTFSDTWSVAVGVSGGVVLAPGAGGLVADPLPQRLRQQYAHAFTVKAKGVLPGTHTRVTCSYRGLSRASVVGADLYDDGATQSEAFANLTLQQPLPNWAGGGERVAAMLDVHNLLAQGYIPFAGDGQPIYLVQTARSVRGGFRVNF